MQCLKEVNAFIEPDISIPALLSLVVDKAEPRRLNSAAASNDLPPSISKVLATDDSFKFKVASYEPIEDGSHQIVGWLVRFKGGGEIIFQL